MGSLVVKLDRNTIGKLSNMHNYSDVDMLNANRPGKNDNIPMVWDTEAVRASIRNILTWRYGESILRPKFGHKLNQSMYAQAISLNKDKIAGEVKRAIEENEPRVKILTVGVDWRDEDNAIVVQVRYGIIGNRTDGAEFVEEATI
jgi:phage baseplate assembly protein W